MQIAFRLDPRLTRGSYIGDRWVSPPTYIRVLQHPGQSIEARTQWLDATGRPIAIDTEWVSADPAIASVSTGDVWGEIAITIAGEGTTAIDGRAGSTSKRMVVTATKRSDGSLYVEIRPEPVAEDHDGGGR